MNELGCFVVPLLFLTVAFSLIALIIAVQTRNRLDRLQQGPWPQNMPAAVPPPPYPAATAEQSPRPEEPVPPVAPVVPAYEPASAPAPPEPIEVPAAAFEAETAPFRAATFEAAASEIEAPPLVADVPPEAPPPPPPAAAPIPPPPPSKPFDWESLVGVKLFSWIAAIALALAGVLFLRYSIERGWLSPPVQMAIGLLAGGALIVLGELRVSRRYATTANAMDGAGLAIIYATFFAAHNVWRLLPAFGAFVAIVAVTALAVWLAIRRDSAFIALLGLLGGFAAPALLSTGRDRPVALFGYLLAVNVGAAWVAYKRNWPALTALSLIFTTIYQWHWVTNFLDASRLPIAAAIFLIFPVAGAIALALASRKATPGKAFERTTQFAAALPLVFGLYAAAIPAYAQNYRLLFSFLFVAGAGLATLAIARRHEALHLLGAVSTVLAFVIWFSSSYTPDSFPHILAITLCFQVLYLAAPLLARRWMRRVSESGEVSNGFTGPAGLGHIAAPLLMFALPTLAVIEPLAASAVWLGGATVLMLLLIGLWSARFAGGGPFAIAFAFAFLAEICWAVDYLRAERAGAGIAFCTAVSLVCFIVCIAARRWNNASRWFPLAEYFGLAGFMWLAFVAGEPALRLPEWRFVTGAAVLLLASAFMARATMRIAPFAIAVALSNFVLLVFAMEIKIGPWPTRSVLLACAVAVFCGAWMLFASKSDPAAPADDTAPAARRPFAPWSLPFATSLFAGMVVAIFATDVESSPPFFVSLGAQLFFIVLLILLARATERHGLAAGAAVMAGLGAFAWREGDEANYPLWQELIFGAGMYAPFVAYAGTLRERIRTFLAPYIAVVIASIAALLYFWTSLDTTWFNRVIGILPLAIAGVLALLLRQLLSLDPGGQSRRGRLALLAAAVLGFVTAAVPMQLDKEWITVAWALEAAALAWLATRIDHRGLVHWSAGLGFAVFARLVLNPSVLSYHDRDVFPILNWYLYTYALAAAALYLGAWWLRRLDDRIGPLPRTSTLFNAGATIILFLLLNIEIADFYSTGSHLTFNFSGTLAQDLTYTLGWALFAMGMLVVGIYLKNKPARIASIALLAVAVLKCFLHDLARLGGLYRVGSLVGLAICLGLVAVLLQRFVLSTRAEPSQEVS